MSTLHLPEGYQYRIYPAKRIRHQHVLETLTPHIPAITLGILTLTLLQWHCKAWIYRISDIIAYTGCLILHNTSHPLLSLCLATLHTTWSILPGSFASLNLPSHAKFMAETKFISPPHASEDEKCIHLLGRRNISRPPTLQAHSVRIMSHSNGLRISNRVPLVQTPSLRPTRSRSPLHQQSISRNPKPHHTPPLPDPLGRTPTSTILEYRHRLSVPRIHGLDNSQGLCSDNQARRRELVETSCKSQRRCG
jgi:hypothetical protein